MMRYRLRNVKQWILIYLFIILLVFSETLGYVLDRYEEFHVSIVWMVLGALTVLGAAVPASAYLGDVFAEKIASDRKKISSQKKSYFKFFWSGCLVCWVPVWLAYWPALLNYDSYNQMSQNAADWYSMQHPLIHTKLMGFFYWLGNDVLKSVNTGFALYSVLQMCILSGCIAYAVNYLYKRNIKPWICGIVMAWACIWPAHPILAISTTKDTIFAAMFLLLFVLSLEWLEAKENWSLKRQLIYLAVLVILVLFRKNGIYAVFLFELGLLASLVIQRKKAIRSGLKKMCVVVLAGIIVSQCASFVIGHALHAAEGSKIEAISVPIQQIARTYMVHREDIPESDQALITAFIPEEALKSYNEHLSDPVKDEADVNVLNEHMNEYVSLYIRLGKAHPKIYLEAFLYSTEGYWYLDDVSHSQIYGWGKDGRQSGYLATDMKEIEDINNVVHNSLLPGVESIYEKIATNSVHQNWPVIRWLFAPAFYVWMTVLGTILLLLNRRTGVVPALFLILGYFATILLGPCCLVRYVYPLALCAPVILIISLEKRKDI